VLPVSGGYNFTDSLLFCNHKAEYFVRAVNSAGESADSNHDNAVTVPCAPRIETVNALTATAVRVVYTDKSTNEEGFRIYRIGSADALVQAILPLPDSNHLGEGFPGGLPCGQKYSYYVKAFNDAGESTASATKDATTSACTVTVTFDSLYVFDDLNAFGPGQFYCGLYSSAVNPRENDIPGRRWPNNGYVEINTGREKPINITMNGVNLLRTQDLFLWVYCHRENFGFEPLFGGFTKQLGAENWSTDQRCEVTNDVKFRVCYTIKVTP